MVGMLNHDLLFSENWKSSYVFGFVIEKNLVGSTFNQNKDMVWEGFLKRLYIKRGFFKQFYFVNGLI